MSHYQRTILLSVGNEVSPQIANQILDILGHPPLFRHIRDVDLAKRDEWQDQLAQALKDISSAQIHAELIQQGFNVRHEEIALWLFLEVGASREVEIHDIVNMFIDVAWRELRSPVLVEVLLWSHPQWIAETKSALTNLAALSQPAQHIFLVSSVTDSGLVLDDASVIFNTALAISHMMTTSLIQFFQSPVEIPIWPREWVHHRISSSELTANASSVIAPESPQVLAFGVNSYVNPMPEIINDLVHDWMRNTLNFMVIQFEENDLDISFRDELEEILPWQPEHLWQLLIARFQRRLKPKNVNTIELPGLFRLARLTKERQRNFEERQNTLRREAESSITEMIAPKLAEWRLYLTKKETYACELVGGQLQISTYRQALRVYHQYWVEWAKMYQHQTETIHSQQSSIKERMFKIQESIEEITTVLAIHTLRDIVQLVVRPLRFWALLQSYLKLPSLLTEYEQNARHWLELETERQASEIIRQYCLAAAEDVVSASQHLAHISEKVEMVAKSTKQSSDVPICMLSTAELARLRKICFFDDELPLTHFLERTPLSIWDNLDVESLQSKLRSFAEEWLSPLQTWSAADVLSFMMRDDEQTIRHWLHNFLERTETLWPNQQASPTNESWLAILLPSEKTAFLRPVVTDCNSIQHIVDGTHSDPILTVRFQPLVSID